MEKLLKYKPPRIALFLILISFTIWHFSPAETIFYMPYKFIGSLVFIGNVQKCGHGHDSALTI
jgi:membrane protease YdiL (CAAX protease family)